MNELEIEGGCSVQTPGQQDQEILAKLFKTVKAKDRPDFVQANLACIECVYAQARRAKLRAPVIVALDLRDSEGAMLARSCVQDGRTVQDIIYECTKEQSIPTAIVAFSRECAKERMRAGFPDLSRELSSNTPASSFHAIVVAFGDRVHWTHSPGARLERPSSKR